MQDLVKPRDVTVAAVSKPGFRVVGLRVSAYMSGLDSDIHRAWHELIRRMPEIDRIKNPQITFGISPPNYKGNAGVLDFYVCVEVDPFLKLPQGMVNLTVEPQTYAVASYRGPMNQKVAAYNETSRWLATSGYTYAPALYFERYDERTNVADPTDEASEFEAYSPIQLVS